ncbi:glycosyltransferase family 2 protein [Hymenobacter arizonensis]|uniref:Glycosyl transferase family 2 n=1 Tax=Hymenobacter arizonensis TaxID=1227077 RepID=A0A1I6A0J7_HYMAR|nr:glycosyltransferase family 2 protein [Hymenobacter arizonensis]SFQ62192.1 Glycosyl transferase family 2 [Hymenobacter arizonensis]
MQEFPSVSVVIPSWNQGRFIDRTLLSILKQDYPGTIEIIVSDGGSTDETVEVLKKYNDRLIWWSARDKGFVDAVTKGVARATGEILAIQSSDDYYLPGAFRAMAAAFQEYPNASFISGGEYAIDLSGNVMSSSSPRGEITPRSILFQSIPPQHATFVKLRYFEETGGMRREVDMCADIDQWYRVAHLAPGHYIPDMLAVYQLHPDQRTATSDKWFPNLVKMVELCEQEPRYGQKFRLTDEERRNLYTYWEINWTGKRDMSLARPIAFSKLLGLLSYSPRTRRMILGTSINPVLKKLVPAGVVDALRPATAAASLYAKPNLDWWKV